MHANEAFWAYVCASMHVSLLTSSSWWGPGLVGNNLILYFGASMVLQAWCTCVAFLIIAMYLIKSFFVSPLVIGDLFQLCVNHQIYLQTFKLTVWVLYSKLTNCFQVESYLAIVLGQGYGSILAKSTWVSCGPIPITATLNGHQIISQFIIYNMVKLDCILQFSG